jgi:hypothetical protein
MKLITACNEGYYRRMSPYLDSLKRHLDIPAVLVTVGFEPEFCAIDHVHLTRLQNAGAPYETESPQHGAFLQVIDGPDDETLIFTDGDIVLQRPLSAIEHAQLDYLEGAVTCGWNSGPTETLQVEAARLYPRVTPMELLGRMGETVNAPCYNIGVIAAKRATWQRIYEAYMPLWPVVTQAFGHPARQQWLVNYVIARLGIPVRLMPYSLHANGHYGIPPGVTLADGLAYYQGDMVAFRHKL